ncbi:MAG: hypothetical protein R3D57_11385 [Hyphomicrobiaceae bacterium]
MTPPRLLLLVAALVSTLSSAGATEIDWRLENPFRLFADARLTERHRQLFAKLSDAERLQPVLSIERRLASQDGRGWARSAFTKTCWSGKANSYSGCGSAGDYIFPKSHRVIVETRDVEVLARRCSWLMTPAGARRNQKPVKIVAPCHEPQTFDIPYPGGAEVALFVDGQMAGRTTIRVKDIFIVGLGDSFASGEGNPDVATAFTDNRDVSYGESPDGMALDGYPTRPGTWDKIGDSSFLDNGAQWWNAPCHRSLYSYQLRAALELAIEQPQRAITFVSFACAGAEITTGLMLQYKGTEWAPHPPDRPQVSAVARTQCGGQTAEEKKYQFTYSLNGKVPALNDIFVITCDREKARKIDLVMLSIGGNDVGFARLVANAMLDDQGVLRDLGGWMGRVFDAKQAEAAMPELSFRYKALARALRANLHIPDREMDRVLLTAYPVMSVLEDGRNVCPNGREGMTVFPEFNLSRARSADGEKAALKLYKAMKQAAADNRWSFVDAHRRAFAGHGVCIGASFEGSDPADDLRFPRRVAGAWVPFPPSQYEPYAPRRRWFRTPNDAYLTGHYHIGTAVAKRVLRLASVSWFQLVLAATYSGAFHPTAEGQAVIADAVAARAREVLAKYGSD